MRIGMISNYLNHHQEPLANSFLSIEGVEYYFIATENITKDRIELGYKEYKSEEYTYLVEFKKDRERAQKLIDEAEIVIIGSAPFKLLKNRITNGKIIFVYTERIFKNLEQTLKVLITGRWFSTYKKTGNYANAYALCAGSYTSSDFSKIGAFKDKTYKWGYFPEFETYNNSKIFNKKNKIKINFLWAGRLIDWKHPEYAIDIARELVKRNLDFSMKIIGTGPLKSKLTKMINDKNMDDCCQMLGAMSPKAVRKFMERTDIFLFTSNSMEGWGVVLNEAMNSACCTIASSCAGSTNFLINDGINGFVYKNKDELLEKVLTVINNKSLMIACQKNAYYTISKMWNPKVAAERFVTICNDLINGNRNVLEYKDGPMSRV